MTKRLGVEEIRTKRNVVITEHFTSLDTRFVYFEHVSGFLIKNRFSRLSIP